MNFRRDTPVKAKRKACRCEWCAEKIEVGAPAVSIAGLGEDFFHGSMHPECWRAERNWWSEERYDVDEGWEAGAYARGMTHHRGAEYPGMARKSSDSPVTKEEIHRTYYI